MSVTSPTTVASTSHLAQIARNLDVAGLDDRHHALLRLAHEDHLGRERLAQRHQVEVDAHAAVAGRGELGGGARKTGTAEVLDALDDAGVEELEAALDEHLLHERVADLHGGALGGAAVVEGVGREDGGAADAVAAGAGAEEHYLVARARSVRQVEVLVAQHADAEGVDERVRLVDAVEDGLAADVRQAQRVAVAADAGDDPGQHPVGVVGVERAEPQLIHHSDRARTHGDDVADDAADSGGRTLVGFDVAGVVVRFDLEGHRPAVPDVDDAGVLADAGEHLADPSLLAELAELLEVHLRRLVRAVLGPHDRVHGELARGRAAAEDLADPGVLVGLEAELGPRLVARGVLGGGGDGVERGAFGHAHNLPAHGCPAAPGRAAGAAPESQRSSSAEPL